MQIRGTGATMRQMESLPKGGLFVWCNNSAYYPQKLAHYIERFDLKIVTPCWIMGQNWRGQRFPGVAVDHAYSLHNTYNPIFDAYVAEIANRKPIK